MQATVVTLPRWRVVLDFGLQYQTVFVRAEDSVGAKYAAEALAKDRCVAVQFALAANQDGPIDAFDPKATAFD